MGTRNATAHEGFTMVVGAAVFALLQLFYSLTWERLFAWQYVTQAWWLNSKPTILITMGVVFLSTAVALWRFRTGLLTGAAAMFAGLVISMSLSLALAESLDLWPVVLLVGGLLLSVPVVLGTLMAAALRKILPRTA